MAAIRNLLDETFGRWTVISFAGTNKHKDAVWNCVCSCGTEKVVSGYAITSGNSRSCGCLNREGTSKRSTTHGKSHTKINTIYLQMIARCYKPNNPGYKRYGGRGITVCSRWLESFENFYADMGEPPTGKTLHRVENNGEYSPDNCVWATFKEQARNTRRNVILTIEGTTKTLIEWCEHYDVDYMTIYQRLRKLKNWTIQEIFESPAGTPRSGYYSNGKPIIA